MRKNISIEDILSLSPCSKWSREDFEKIMPENNTVTEIVMNENTKEVERLFVLLQIEDVFDDNTKDKIADGFMTYVMDSAICFDEKIKKKNIAIASKIYEHKKPGWLFAFYCTISSPTSLGMDDDFYFELALKYIEEQYVV